MSKVLFEILLLVSMQKKIIKGTACKVPLYGTALNTVGHLSICNQSTIFDAF
jgi:hypothetical protein